MTTNVDVLAVLDTPLHKLTPQMLERVRAVVDDALDVCRMVVRSDDAHWSGDACKPIVQRARAVLDRVEGC